MANYGAVSVSRSGQPYGLLGGLGQGMTNIGNMMMINSIETASQNREANVARLKAESVERWKQKEFAQREEIARMKSATDTEQLEYDRSNDAANRTSREKIASARAAGGNNSADISTRRDEYRDWIENGFESGADDGYLFGLLGQKKGQQPPDFEQWYSAMYPEEYGNVSGGVAQQIQRQPPPPSAPPGDEQNVNALDRALSRLTATKKLSWYPAAKQEDIENAGSTTGDVPGAEFRDSVQEGAKNLWDKTKSEFRLTPAAKQRQQELKNSFSR